MALGPGTGLGPESVLCSQHGAPVGSTSRGGGAGCGVSTRSDGIQPRTWSVRVFSCPRAGASTVPHPHCCRVRGLHGAERGPRAVSGVSRFSCVLSSAGLAGTSAGGLRAGFAPAVCQRGSGQLQVTLPVTQNWERTGPGRGVSPRPRGGRPSACGPPSAFP